MALISQETTEKVRFIKKEIKLKQHTWTSITAYAKYAKLTGQNSSKRDYVIEEAIQYLFKQDKGFQAYLKEQDKVKAQATTEAPVEAPKTVSGTVPKNK